MAPFYDRDREQKELISILEHEPSRSISSMALSIPAKQAC